MMPKQDLQIIFLLFVSLVGISTAFLPSFSRGVSSPHVAGDMRTRFFASKTDDKFVDDIQDAADDTADSMKDAFDDGKETVDDVRENVQDAAEDLRPEEKKDESTWEKTKDVAGDIKDSIKDKAVNVKDSVKSAAGTVKDKVVSAKDKVVDTLTGDDEE